MTSLFCNDTVADFLGHFSLSVAPKLLYYSYIPIFFVSIFFSLYLYKKTKSLESKIILIIASCFCLWILFDIITWISVDATINMLSWQLAVIPDLLIYFFVFYLVYIFNLKKDLPLTIKTTFLIFFVFFLSLITTKYNYYDFSIDTCEPSVGPISNILLPVIRVLTLISILLIGVVAIYKKKINRTNLAEIIIFNIGSFLLVLVYGFLQFFGDFTNSYDINLVGPLGMVAFLGLLVFLIVHYKAFDIKLLGAQALVWALVILIGSQFLYMSKMPLSLLIITGATLIIASVVGMTIVRGVKREISLRESLEIANRNQQSLIHFVSHQLKGFFAKSKMIFAGFLEGDFGETSPTGLEMAKTGLQSDNNAVAMIQDILGASNLKEGTTQYSFKNVSLNDLIKKVCDLYSDQMTKKGLKFDVQITDQPITTFVDETQIVQVFKNLIDNAIKYSPSGTVNASLKIDPNGLKALFEIKDTGIGLTESDKNRLFTEGGKGEESLKYNTDSAGYGLYIVKKIVETHKGKIWAESEGRGKGSKFCVELPIVQTKV